MIDDVNDEVDTCSMDADGKYLRFFVMWLRNSMNLVMRSVD